MNYQKTNWAALARPRIEKFRKMRKCKPVVDRLENVCKALTEIDVSDCKGRITVSQGKRKIALKELVDLIAKIKKYGNQNFGIIQNPASFEMARIVFELISKYLIKVDSGDGIERNIRFLQTRIEEIKGDLVISCKAAKRSYFRDRQVETKTKRERSGELDAILGIAVSSKLILEVSKLFDLQTIENIARVILDDEFAKSYELEKIERRLDASCEMKADKRMELLRMKYQILCPKAIEELKRQSEIPAEKRRINETGQNDSELICVAAGGCKILDMNEAKATFPRLTALIFGPDMDERARKRELKILLRKLEREKVPKEFYMPKIRSGKGDADKIITEYLASLKKDVPEPEIKPEKQTSIAVPTMARGKSAGEISEEEKLEIVAKEMLATMILSRFGTGLDGMPAEKNDILKRMENEVLAFIKSYLKYINAPEGERGTFAINGSVNGSTFVEKRLPEGKDGKGWRFFSGKLNYARIVIGVKVDERKIQLYLVETEHSKYSSELAKLTHFEKGSVEILKQVS